MTKPTIATVDELQSELSGYYGSETTYRHPLGLIYTEGIKAVAELVGAYWLLDVVGSYRPALKGEDFIIWRVESKDGTGRVSARTDTNEPDLISQTLEYTDFPEGVFEFYGISSGNATPTLLLKSEY